MASGTRERGRNRPRKRGEVSEWRVGLDPLFLPLDTEQPGEVALMHGHGGHTALGPFRCRPPSFSASKTAIQKRRIYESATLLISPLSLKPDDNSTNKLYRCVGLWEYYNIAYRSSVKFHWFARY
jgi:hypothetical protein